MSKKGFFSPYKYVYDEYFNCVICPENQVLSYVTTNRAGYREFKSKGDICRNCPSRNMCTKNRNFEKTVVRHIWSDYLETAEDIRHTPEYQKMETIERVFADAKEKYAMRYTSYRGLTQVTNWVRLKFAAMNLKKYAIHRWSSTNPTRFYTNFYFFLPSIKNLTLNSNWHLGFFYKLSLSLTTGFYCSFFNLFSYFFRIPFIILHIVKGRFMTAPARSENNNTFQIK